jgi:hypothetical protein
MTTRKKREKRSKPPSPISDFSNRIEPNQSPANRGEEAIEHLRSSLGKVLDSLHGDDFARLHREQPATAELLTAFFIGGVALVHLQPNDLGEKAQRRKDEIAQEMAHIATWISGTPTPPSPEGVISLIMAWRDAGYPLTPKQTAGAIELATRPRVGRPVTSRPLGRQALDEKLRSGTTWTKLTWKFCDCGKEHTAACTGRIRRRAVELKHLLPDLSRWAKSLIDFVHGQNDT